MTIDFGITETGGGRSVLISPNSPTVGHTSPCQECPWRKSNDGFFNAKNFELMAVTAETGSEVIFGCHMHQEAACVGAILAGNNTAWLSGQGNCRQIDQAEMHESFNSLARANGHEPKGKHDSDEGTNG